ncbi:MAG: ABC-F family ATP-binding cassette domain-containing protein [Gemmobacter sp.]
MARAPLMQLSGITLGHGGNPLFAGLDLAVQPGDRVALVGRNGSGKSTLMRVMAGLVEPDAGVRMVPPGISVGYMEQDPDMAGFETLGDWALAGLDPGEGWRLEAAAEGLGFEAARPVATASGGERRRAALARLLAAEADLWLLDEPTNHLDIAAIGWLEARLAETRAAYVLISHDRAFLRRLTRAVLWLDRGQARRREAGFEGFEDWRETVWAEEDAARHKLDRKIKAEARWAVEGISARRKRNQGRVRALADLRAERAAQIRRQGTADLALEAAPQSGARVIEARGLTHRFGDVAIVRGLDLRVMRGDRIAFVGPNGAGKTTLLRLLTGEIAPDAGTVQLGTALEVAVFDQTRAQLTPEASLWENLTADPRLGVGGRADQVMVRGVPRHVVGYLKDFLFDEAQARAPVRSLSGGERARLLLARIMARASNLLILDEPTNDLDIETLDLLQDVLGEYDGTVLLVSHDRDFIDRVATQTVLMEGAGRATVYAGGWSDMVAQRAAAGLGTVFAADPGAGEAGGPKGAARPAGGAAGEPQGRGKGLSFAERHRLDTLPDEIDRLTAEIARLGDLLSDPDLFAREPVKFRKASEALAQRQAALAAAEDDWLALAERAEPAG